MNITYTFSILTSLLLHLVLVADFPAMSSGDVRVELSSSQSSFRVNLDRRIPVEKKAPKTRTLVQQQKEKVSEKSAAKSSISVENKYIPKYPYKSRIFEEEGSVVVTVSIDRNGKIVDSFIAKSSGHERLDLAALEASKKSSFNMTTLGDESFISHNLEFEFKLSK